MTPEPTWPLGQPRQLRPGQRAEVWTVDVDAPAGRRLVHSSSDRLLEAPNWTPDGHSLLLNGDGLLWRLDLDSSDLHHVDLDGVPPLNNDHVIDAGNRLVYLSANDGHIWVADLEGGAGRRITHDDSRFHFLHGVSPDGTTLAFVDLPAGDFGAAGRLALVAATGGVTRYPEAGRKHLDGPEYSPDGAWFYVNTEEFSTRPGHAQLARLPAEGGHLEQLVSSDTVDWFPHLSPDGELATYISFPPGTRGHPPDLPVEVRLVRTSDWSAPIATYPLFGGQGTLNVNSWAADSRQFAFVTYPIDATP
jgi:TolB protein